MKQHKNSTLSDQSGTLMTDKSTQNQSFRDDSDSCSVLMTLTPHFALEKVSHHVVIVVSEFSDSKAPNISTINLNENSVFIKNCLLISVTENSILITDSVSNNNSSVALEAAKETVCNFILSIFRITSTSIVFS